MPVVRITNGKAHSQMDNIHGMMSTATEGPLNARVVPPLENIHSVEAEGKRGGDDGDGDDETNLSDSPTQAKPPTPPCPYRTHEAFNIVTDNLEDMDTTMYFSDQESEDKDGDDGDVEILGEYLNLP